MKLTLIKNGKDVKKEDSDQLLTVNEDLKSIGELNISNKDSIIIEPIPSNAEITTKSEVNFLILKILIYIVFTISLFLNRRGQI